MMSLPGTPQGEPKSMIMNTKHKRGLRLRGGRENTDHISNSSPEISPDSVRATTLPVHASRLQESSLHIGSDAYKRLVQSGEESYIQKRKRENSLGASKAPFQARRFAAQHHDPVEEVYSSSPLQCGQRSQPCRNESTAKMPANALIETAAPRSGFAEINANDEDEQFVSHEVQIDEELLLGTWWNDEDLWSSDDESLFEQEEALAECPNPATSSVAAEKLPNFHRKAIERLCAVTDTADIEQYVIRGVREAMGDTLLSFPIQDERVEVVGAWHLLILLYVWHRARLGRSMPKLPITDQCGVLLFTGIGEISRVCEDPEFVRTEIYVNIGLLEKSLLANSFFKAAWYTKIPQLTSRDHFTNIDSEAQEYLDALDKGLIKFVNKVIEKDRQGRITAMRKGTVEKSPELVREELIKMFASTNENLLRSCISRTISRDSKIKGHPTKKALRVNREIAAETPAQYINILCDNSGTAPTRAQYYAIFRDLSVYLEDSVDGDAMAAEIDQTIAPDTRWPEGLSRGGLRRYLDWRNVTIHKRYVQADYRRPILKDFLRIMGAMASNNKYKWDAPMPFPFIEIGFSDNPIRRLGDHVSHHQSNYLMNVVEAAFERRFPSMLRLRQEILHVCFTQAQTWLGEIVFTSISKGYVEQASGFSHHTAGYSNGSSYRRRTGRDWDRLAGYALEYTPLRANLSKIQSQERARRLKRDKRRSAAVEGRRRVITEETDFTERAAVVFTKATELGSW